MEHVRTLQKGLTETPLTTPWVVLTEYFSSVSLHAVCTYILHTPLNNLVMASCQKVKTQGELPLPLSQSHPMLNCILVISSSDTCGISLLSQR